MRGERAALRPGLVALTKAVVVIGGVPVATVRLWGLVPPSPEHRFPELLVAPGLFEHGVLVVVCVLWAASVVRLGRELAAALRTRSTTGQPADWSTRWASAIAGLLLLAVASAATNKTLGNPRADSSRATSVSTGSARSDIGMVSPPPVDHRNPYLAGELMLLGIGLLGSAALIHRVHALRRVGESHRRPGERHVLVPGAAAVAAAALRPLTEDDLLEWVGLTNRLVAAQSTESGPIPPLRFVRASATELELVFVEPAREPPFPFREGCQRSSWALDRSLGLDAVKQMIGAAPPAYPGLIPIGENGGDTYLVAPGPQRQLGILGDPKTVDGCIAGMALALRSCPWSFDLDVELIGISPPPESEGCYHLHSSNRSTLTAIAAAEASDRVRDSSAQRDLLVVTARGSLGDEAERVIELLSPIAGIIHGGVAGSENLVLESDRAVLYPDAIELRPFTPTSAQCELADRMLRGASTPTGPGTPVRRDSFGQRTHFDAATIEVRLLDDVPGLVDGGGEPIADITERIIEIVAYLVLHGRKVPLAELARAIAPAGHRSMTIGICRRRCAEVERALGTDHEGVRMLSISTTGIVRLCDEVGCDWIRFLDRCASARNAPAAVATARWASALRLVTGQPFGRVRSGFGWVFAEGLDLAICSEVIDTAHALTEFALARKDPELARWSIRIGLKIEPASEILARDQMILHRELDEPGLVGKVFDELESALDALGGEEPTVETRVLLAALSGPDGSPDR